MTAEDNGLLPDDAIEGGESIGMMIERQEAVLVNKLQALVEREMDALWNGSGGGSAEDLERLCRGYSLLLSGGAARRESYRPPQLTLPSGVEARLLREQLVKP